MPPLPETSAAWFGEGRGRDGSEMTVVANPSRCGQQRAGHTGWKREDSQVWGWGPGIDLHTGRNLWMREREREIRVRSAPGQASAVTWGAGGVRHGDGAPAPSEEDLSLCNKSRRSTVYRETSPRSLLLRKGRAAWL